MLSNEVLFWLQSSEQTGDIEVLMERMKKLREEEEEVTREEMNRRFEKEKDEASHGLIPGINSLQINRFTWNSN